MTYWRKVFAMYMMNKKLLIHKPIKKIIVPF